MSIPPAIHQHGAPWAANLIYAVRSFELATTLQFPSSDHPGPRKTLRHLLPTAPTQTYQQFMFDDMLLGRPISQVDVHSPQERPAPDGVRLTRVPKIATVHLSALATEGVPLIAQWMDWCSIWT